MLDENNRIITKTAFLIKLGNAVFLPIIDKEMGTVFDYLYEKDVAAMQTIIIPKVLFSSDKFSQLSAKAKVLYALFLGCFENGCQYANYSVKKICDDLCCSAERTTELLTELSDFHLIHFENNRINVISLWEREDSNV